MRDSLGKYYGMLLSRHRLPLPESRSLVCVSKVSGLDLCDSSLKWYLYRLGGWRYLVNICKKIVSSSLIGSHFLSIAIRTKVVLYKVSCMDFRLRLQLQVFFIVIYIWYQKKLLKSTSFAFVYSMTTWSCYSFFSNQCALPFNVKWAL